MEEPLEQTAVQRSMTGDQGDLQEGKRKDKGLMKSIT